MAALAGEPLIIKPRRHASSTSNASVVSVQPTSLRGTTTPTDPHSCSALSSVFTRNIANLERSAEEMSAGGSDIGEAIRMLSRQNSVQSSHNGEISVVRPRVGSRSGSGRSGSYSRYNGYSGGRWGGYSPSGSGNGNGFAVTSPVGSASGSWSHVSVSRVTSGASGSRKSSRLAQVSEPLQEGRPLDSPLRPSFSIHEGDEEQEHRSISESQYSREVSQSSFAQRYDEIADEIEHSLEHIPPSPPKHNQVLYHDYAPQYLSPDLEEQDRPGATTPPSRPRSTDTFREAQVAFHDFDGVHFSPDTDEYVETDQDGKVLRRVSAISVDAASMLRTPRAVRPVSQLPVPAPAPPPEDGMVYYPAPVPRMLNLPKRLSQLPAASVQAKRKSQVLSQLPPDVRAGAPWLNGGESGHRRDKSGSSNGTLSGQGFLNERMSGNASDLPPQLRANLFFEHQPVQQDVQVKSESAVATLDSILAASATAPVNAFMDHPFAGDVRQAVYAPEKRVKRRSTATLGTVGTASAQGSPESQKKMKGRRRSSIGSLLKRTSSSDELTSALRRSNGSRSSILTDLGGKLRKRRSQLSLGDELGEEAAGPVHTPADELEEPDMQSGLIRAARNVSFYEAEGEDRRVFRVPTVMSNGHDLEDGDQIEADFEEREKQDDVGDDGEPVFVQPSTLLAELQVRKAQLKSRSRTAATSFPNGMHSTLLELDTVEEINKKKRQRQRIQLAWEDPHQRALEQDMDKGDEDVPLGMLFPGNSGAARGERPLGLMERRLLEDNEPLSSRRQRLTGRGREGERVTPGASQVDLLGGVRAGEGAVGEEDNEGGGETLGERLRVLKTREVLDAAVSDVAPKDGERPNSTFADDVLSQLGALDVKDNYDVDVRASPRLEEEETLGQRRARLQREREASGDQPRNVSDGSAAPANRPALRSTNSLANLLATNPVGQRATSKSHQPAQGSLLHANEQMQARQKSQLQHTNMRSSSYFLEKNNPLVESGGRRQSAYQSANNGRLLLGELHHSRAPAGGFGGGTYNNGMGGVQLPQATPVLATGGMGGGYCASPTAGAMGAGGYGMMGYPPQQHMTPGGGFGFPQAQMPMMSPFAYNPPPAYGNPGMMGSGGFMGNAFVPQTMGGGTYATYAQNLGAFGPGGGMSGLDLEGLEPGQRAAIERWRGSVGMQ